MDMSNDAGDTAAHRTGAVRKSDRELVVTRSFNGPVRNVYAAWTQPELFRRWWAPKSMGMTIDSCEMDVRTGGSYRLTISHPSAPGPMTFFGRYTEVVPLKRMVWTNEEDESGAVTTVTFEEQAGRTLLTISETYPSKEVLDQVLEQGASGMADGMPEQFGQLDDILAELGTGLGR